MKKSKLAPCYSVVKPSVGIGTLEENNWIDDELNGYDIMNFKSLKEQEEGLPEYRKADLVYYDLRNLPLIGMKTEQAELLGASKIPNPISELETSKQLTLTNGPMLDLINNLSRGSHSRCVQCCHCREFYSYNFGGST